MKFDEKQSELSLCVFIIQQCLFLLWTHLDYYVRYVQNKGYERTQNDLLHTMGNIMNNGIRTFILFCVTFL